MHIEAKAMNLVIEIKWISKKQVVLQFYSLSVPGSIQHYGHCLFGVLLSHLLKHMLLWNPKSLLLSHKGMLAIMTFILWKKKMCTLKNNTQTIR